MKTRHLKIGSKRAEADKPSQCFTVGIFFRLRLFLAVKLLGLPFR